MLTQVRIHGVRTSKPLPGRKDNWVSMEDIARAAGLPVRFSTIPTRVGRGPDGQARRTEGDNRHLRAHGYDLRMQTFDDPTVEVSAFAKSGDVRNQWRLREEIIRFARDSGGTIEATARTLENQPVPLSVHGLDMKSTRLAGYGDDFYR